MSVPNLPCRSCGSTGVQSFHCSDQQLGFCTACSLVQRIGADVPLQEEFLASTCPHRQRTAQELAAQLIEARRLGRGSLVVEAGSNDGWLLRRYRSAGVPVLGLDSDREAARLARQRHGIPTREIDFGKHAVDLLVSQGLRADVFHAHDVLNRAADPLDFLRGVHRLLRDDGLAVLEVPYVRTLLDAPSECETESVCYFSLTALCHCLIGHGLLLEAAGRTGHGSLRVSAVPARPGVWPRPSVNALLREEETWGVRTFDTYAALGRRALAVAA